MHLSCGEREREGGRERGGGGGGRERGRKREGEGEGQKDRERGRGVGGGEGEEERGRGRGRGRGWERKRESPIFKIQVDTCCMLCVLCVCNRSLCVPIHPQPKTSGSSAFGMNPTLHLICTHNVCRLHTLKSMSIQFMYNNVCVLCMCSEVMTVCVCVYAQVRMCGNYVTVCPCMPVYVHVCM